MLGQVDDQVRRMATGLAGGVGGTHQELCGALSAGVLLIGALYGRLTPDEDDGPCYDLASRYRERFIQEWGTTRCGELRAMGYGSDGSMPCSVLVERAARIFLELLASKKIES
ncbi:MAG: C_GCAxxG_C_C family protein [Anaerolineales bacterium]|nr:MAG: C_GCAxxG_C_C family protein [Anaerolineales bacterium]